MSGNIGVTVLLVELPVLTTSAIGAGVAFVRAQRKTRDLLTDVKNRLQIDANDDARRDERIDKLERRTEADHDMLVATAEWAERHDKWSGDNWERHMREYHSGRRRPADG